MSELDRFLRRREVEQTIGFSTAMLYKMMAIGQFPKQVKLGGMSMWSAREIAEWQQKQLASRDVLLP